MLKTEIKRQLLHIAIALLAFFLKYLSFWQALIAALAAFSFNFLIIPQLKLKYHFFRREEKAKPVAIGFVSYTFSIIILILIFPLEIVSIAWAVMGFGDGFSSLIGILYGKKKLNWNKQKSYAGFIAFFLSSFIITMIMLFWNNFQLSLMRAIGVSAILSISGAIVESLPIKADDNLTVPSITAILAYFLIKFI